MKKYKAHSFDGEFYWLSSANRIYKSKSFKPQKMISPYKILPWSLVKNFFFNPINRLLRTGIHNIITFHDGYVVVVNKKLLIYKKNNLKKVINIPRGSRPLRNGLIIVGDNLIFGDYWRNKNNKKSNVYKIDLNTYKKEIILSLSVRHIHFITPCEGSDKLVIGTGDSDNESKILLYDLKIKSLKNIGSGSQKYRAVSILQRKNILIWATDSPNSKNYIMNYNLQTEKVKIVKEILGPAYYSTVNSKNQLFIATTIEDRFSHRSIIYTSFDGTNWDEFMEFKKDILHGKLFGYGIVEFISGQERLPNLVYNLVNLKND